MSRILVTGATGFIGSHLVRRCVQRGDEVTVVVRPTSNSWRLSDLASRIKFREAELTDRKRIHEIINAAQPRCVFHLATATKRRAGDDLMDASISITSDLAGLITVLAACNQASSPPGVFVRAASIAEYGYGPEPFSETDREAPANVYGASLLAATKYAQSLRSRLRFAMRSARLALVYGPMQAESFLIPALIERCLNGEQSRIENPDDRRDLIFIEDTVEALLTIADAETEESLFNISSGHGPTMREVAQIVLHTTGARSGLVTCASSPAGAEPSILVADAKKAGRLLGWQASTKFSEGVAKTVDAYRLQRGNMQARTA